MATATEPAKMTRARDAQGRFIVGDRTAVPDGMELARDKGVLQVRRQKAGSWDEKKRETFLATLAATANVLESCRAVDMTPAGVYQLRKRDPEFRAQWQTALREAYQQLELTLLDRSINGRERPVYYAGEVIGAIHHYPDRLAMNLLMHHRAAGAPADRAGPTPEMLAEAQARVVARFAAKQPIERQDSDA
jgi:hypothetical protein